MIYELTDHARELHDAASGNPAGVVPVFRIEADSPEAARAQWRAITGHEDDANLVIEEVKEAGA